MAAPVLKFAITVDDAAGFAANVTEGQGRDALTVVDAHSKWCGPAEALNKKLQNVFQDYIDYDVKLVLAVVDDIPALSEQADKSKPLILFYKGGSEVDRISGANACELERKITKHAVKKAE